MKLLLDTHLLLWASTGSAHLTPTATALIEDVANTLWFSAASIWEISIKNSLGRKDFRVDVRILHQALCDNGYREIPITGEHGFLLESLPPIHKDPFDRILIAQALTEGLMLLTNDAVVAEYPAPIRYV